MEPRSDVNQMVLQPFLACQAHPHGYVDAPVRIHRDPGSYQIGFGGFVAHPEIGPSWKIRGAIVILLPRRN